MKRFFLAWLTLLIVVVSGCAVADDPSAPAKAMDAHSRARASLSDAHTGSQLGCPKPIISTKAPWLGKINANLLCAAAQAEAKGASFADMAARMGIVTVKTGVALDIVTNRLDADVERKLRLPGVTIRYLSVKYHRVAVVISDPMLLYQLAKIPEVRTIMPEYGGRTRGSNMGAGIRVKPKLYK